MKIVVVGPQRSGSTFVSHCLAQSFNAKHIDEMEFDVYFLDLFYKIVEGSGDSWVAHAPGLFADMFKILDKIPDVTFAIVRRDIKEIVNSQSRINLNLEHEKIKLFLCKETGEQHVAPAKYEYWDKWKKYLPSWVEYDYRDFENHPFWVPDEARKTFESKQWKAEK
jgi:hypothetical protein